MYFFFPFWSSTKTYFKYMKCGTIIALPKNARQVHIFSRNHVRRKRTTFLLTSRLTPSSMRALTRHIFMLSNSNVLGKPSSQFPPSSNVLVCYHGEVIRAIIIIKFMKQTEELKILIVEFCYFVTVTLILHFPN